MGHITFPSWGWSFQRPKVAGVLTCFHLFVSTPRVLFLLISFSPEPQTLSQYTIFYLEIVNSLSTSYIQSRDSKFDLDLVNSISR